MLVWKNASAEMRRSRPHSCSGSSASPHTSSVSPPAVVSAGLPERVHSTPASSSPRPSRQHPGQRGGLELARGGHQAHLQQGRAAAFADHHVAQLNAPVGRRPDRLAPALRAPALPRLQALLAAPPEHELARPVAPLGGQQAVVHRAHAARAGGVVKATDQLACGAGPERVLELVAVAPLRTRRRDRLELEVLQPTEPPQRLADLLALDLELALVGEHLPRDAGVLCLRCDPLGAGAQHLERAGVRVGALALVHHRPDAVSRNRAGDEHHVPALAQARHPLAPEGERLDLELELIAPLRPGGGGERSGLGRVAHEEPPAGATVLCRRASSSSSSAFWAWRRFSACSQMRWRSP